MSSSMREAGTDETGELEEDRRQQVIESEGWLRVREREGRLRVEKLGLAK